jgi:hypothetical protein
MAFVVCFCPWHTANYLLNLAGVGASGLKTFQKFFTKCLVLRHTAKVSLDTPRRPPVHLSLCDAPGFSAGVINPNEPVDCVDLGQTTVNLGHHLKNFTNDP